jgi:thiol-disulfide isomerase/thioredoxin
MKPLRSLAALLVGTALVLVGCTSSGSGDGTYVYRGSQSIGSLIKIADRKPVADFSGSLLDGGTYHLTQDAGKVTVVNFWGQWCGPCKIETPQFGQMYDAYKAKDTTFVGIDILEPNRAKPRAFVRANNIHYPIVYDEDGETALKMGNISVRGAPFTVLLDKHHRVAAVYALRLAPADLEPVLNKLIAEK